MGRKLRSQARAAGLRGTPYANPQLGFIAVRGLVQRVSEASVSVDGVVVGKIGRGLCTLVGVGCDDDEKAADRLAAKIWQLRLFPDGTGNMNRSAEELGLPVLVVSQFTLYADTTRGRRPSFTRAAAPEVARSLVDRVVAQLRAAGAEVATGHFGAMMDVSLVNQGPVTVLVET
jgi:D-aminoacyl-tRNA deacylase